MKPIRTVQMENKRKMEDNKRIIREDTTMTNARANEIMNKMTAFGRESYAKVELIDEFFKLQREMAAITFGEDQSEGKRFYDISDHFAEMNRANNRVSAEKIEEFRKECGAATNCIRAEVSGRKGESRTFYKLNLLTSEHRMRKNVEIGDGTKKTEIDALVVTEKAAFIIEVKNTKRDIFIDADGQYYRTGEYLNWDSDLGKKLELREEFVREAAERSGIHNLKVIKIVVFTDNRISVQNKCKSIKTCFLNNLTSIVDNCAGETILTLNEMDLLMTTVDAMTKTFSYVPLIDIKKFKADFAEMIAALDNKNEKVTKKTWIMTWREFVSSISHRKVAA